MKYFRQKQAQKGFTLIELMIAVAIVGILAAVALPAFASYLTRARVVEGVNYAQGCKTGVLEYHASMGRLPADNDAASCPQLSTENVKSVDVAAGIITVVFQDATTGANASALPTVLQGESLVLSPLDEAGNAAADGSAQIASWTCEVSTADILEYVPAECRTVAAP